jgi:hypothetical protein
MQLVEAILQIINCGNLDIVASSINSLNEIDRLLRILTQTLLYVYKSFVSQVNLLLNQILVRLNLPLGN